MLQDRSIASDALRYYPFGWYNFYNLAMGWDETDLKYEEKFKALIGTSAVYNGKEKDKKLADTDSIIGNVDLGMRCRGFIWDSEYYIRENDPEDDGGSITSDGFYTQAGYFVLPKKLELAARYSMLDPNEDLRDDVMMFRRSIRLASIITCVGIANRYRLTWVTS